MSQNDQIVDLTMPLRDGMDAFPGEPTASFTQFSSVHDETGIEMWNVRLFSQLGTHLDAPSHFIPGGSSIESIDLDACIGPATVVDVPSALIDDSILMPVEADIRATGRVLFRTGWSAHLSTSTYWRGFPELSVEAARTLVAWGVRFVGLDTPTPSTADLHAVHTTLLGANIVLAECLVNLDRLSSRTHLICLPLPLVGLDGSPARIIAIEPHRSTT